MELNQLKQIFTEIKSWDNSISSDIALDCATRIYNSQNIREPSKTKSSDYQPKATDKQVAFLKQLGYEGDVDSLGIKDAKVLIQELKDKKKFN